jgi:hypothetical protein
MDRTDAAVESSGPPLGGSGGDSEGGGGEPWIETTRGGLFFINALLIFPYPMVLVPLATRVFVRGVLGGAARESSILDTFPLLAGHLLPRVGWLIVVPLYLVVRNLRIEEAPWPRAALFLFLIVHLGFLGWTGAGWMGVHDWVLPGAPP